MSINQIPSPEVIAETRALARLDRQDDEAEIEGYRKRHQDGTCEPQLFMVQVPGALIATAMNDCDVAVVQEETDDFRTAHAFAKSAYIVSDRLSKEGYIASTRGVEYTPESNDYIPENGQPRFRIILKVIIPQPSLLLTEQVTP